MDDELVEQVAKLQLAAFLAGRSSVSSVVNGNRAAKPAPSMDDFRRMAIAAMQPHIEARCEDAARRALEEAARKPHDQADADDIRAIDPAQFRSISA